MREAESITVDHRIRGFAAARPAPLPERKTASRAHHLDWNGTTVQDGGSDFQSATAHVNGASASCGTAPINLATVPIHRTSAGAPGVDVGSTVIGFRTIARV